ncbi:uncharacterized protein [Apostichopus japonicus]|uniref:uncharacterized protein n=1 Tax=Stichopus japonicus TaxID=307972 RepID=UPI003AB8E2CE
MSLTTSVVIAILSIIFLVGVPGNVLTLLVYVRKARKSSTFVFISFMAISDLILCCSLPFQIWFAIGREAGFPNQYLCKSSYFVSTSCITLSLVSSAAVSVDRYLAVCHPIKRRLSVRTSLALSAFCALITLVVAVPSFALSTVIEIDGTDTCRLISNDSLLAYVRKAISVLTFIFAVTLTTVCYTLVWLAIRRQKKIQDGWIVSHSLPTSNKENSNIDKDMISHVTTSVHPNCEEIQPQKSLTDTSHINPSVDEERVQSIGDAKLVTLPPTSNPELFENREGTNSNGNGLIRTSKTVTFNAKSNGSTPNGASQSSKGRQPKSSERGTSTGSVNDRVQRRLTTMLFFNTVVTVATICPMLIATSIPENSSIDSHTEKQAIFDFRRILVTIGFINCSTNPFIYSLLDKKFRRECQNALRCGKCSK